MNIGVVTGGDERPARPRRRSRKGWDQSLRDLERVYGALPETVVALTGGGGRHVFFQHPGTPVPNSVGMLGPGLDVRGDGGFVVGVGSRHRSGRPYAWDVTADPDMVVLAAVPPSLLERMRTRARARLPVEGIPLVLRKGERNDRLFQIGWALRCYGLGEDALRHCLTAVNHTHATPPLDDEEVARIARERGALHPGDAPSRSGGRSDRAYDT